MAPVCVLISFRRPPPATTTESRLSFYEIAKKHGTDKVTSHKYHNIYQKYLEPIRDNRLKFLEIGLGCDMGYGPGASYYTWLEYLPNVDLYYIEYDAECAKKWKEKTNGASVFAGDQADVEFLERFIRETGGNFDVMVDDGGHSMVQQKTSLDTLWKALKPGGYYFCEDLETSYRSENGGGGPDSTMERFKANMDEMTTQNFKHPYMSEVFSIDCMKEVCGFSKKQVDGLY
jgi:frataxin-like iron-binding protein CyaY